MQAGCSPHGRGVLAVQITQDSTLQADPVLAATVAEKNWLLETAIDGSAAEATWELNGEPGRPNLILRVRDPEGYRSSATFAPVELKNETGLTSRLGDLNEALLRVAEWRKAVDTLFARIRPWCEALSGSPAVCKNINLVREERSGEYLVRELFVIPIGGDRLIDPLMVFTPVAAWVVGWDGRVDMTGPGDRYILNYSRAAGAWYHVPNYLPYRQLPLTETLFRELAEACLDG
ncbi:MAG: hypothetical protein JWO38_4070 [Gemmataceae bacterium]|nr:hypothetical protein [Gemmataceae bacterium]